MLDEGGRRKAEGGEDLSVPPSPFPRPPSCDPIPLPPSIHSFRATDSYAFYYRHWPATGRPRARVVFVHGIRSHGGWYGRSCAEIAAAGYDVYLLDRRGAGLNTAGRGDTPTFRRLLDDIAEFIAARTRECGWLPTVLAGISWGGKLAVGLPYRKPGLIDGLVLLCPGLVPKVAPPFVGRVRIAVARVFRPDKFFPVPLNEPDLFTADPEWRRFVDAERHGLREATARFLFGSFSLDLYLRRAAKRVTVPTLLLLAGQDRVIDNAGTRRFVLGFPTRDSRVIDYPAAHHTLEFEGSGHPFVDDLVRWMEKRW